MQGNTNVAQSNQTAAITPEALLDHWQGHRRLTRRVIEAFPEEHFFTYSIGGMRPFGGLVEEIAGIADGGIEGLATNKWSELGDGSHMAEDQQPKTKEEVLKLWDAITDKIDSLWKLIPPQKFEEKVLAFNMYEGTVYSTILYFIDNEIHHRGQAYVYLRSLGIEPPPFWGR